MLPCYFLICSDIIYTAPESLSPWLQSSRTFHGEQHKTNQTPTWQLATCDENGFLFSSQTCTQPCLSVAVNSQSPLSELQWHRCKGETICCWCPPAAPINRPRQYTPSLTVEKIWKPLTLTATEFSTITDVSQSATMWFPWATHSINESYQPPEDSLWLKTKMTFLTLHTHITYIKPLFYDGKKKRQCCLIINNLSPYK